MPTYGYRCTACETTFERFQKITDPPITECVECGAPVKKILYPVGIAFKGSGFYVNDYASSSSSGKSSKSDDSASATSTTSTEAKSESSTPPASTPATTTKTDA